MDMILIVALVILALGGITGVALYLRDDAGPAPAQNDTPHPGDSLGATTTWPVAPGLPAAAPGATKGPKVRVLSINGNAPAGPLAPPSPLVKVPGTKKPVLKVAPGDNPPLVAKATPPPGKPGTGGLAHVTKVVNVPAFCPICGLVAHADGCPRKHVVN